LFPSIFHANIFHSIRHHAGVFYVICTNVLLGDTPADERRHNFVVSSIDPSSDIWSAPIFIEADGQDPGLIWDSSTEKCYVHLSAVPHPPGPYTSIDMFEVDLTSGAVLSEQKVLWRGTGGIYIEGPHIYKKDGWYYLLVSEGGCFPDHMITAARSRELFGPYEAAEGNPVMPPASEGAYVAHTGHGDLVRDQEGQWWSICLGVRKDAKGRYNMGRETFLTPVEWPEGGFPVFAPVEMNPKELVTRARGRKAEGIAVAKKGVEFCYIRDVDLSKHRVAEDGTITLTPDVGFFSDVYKPTSFVGKRQRKHDGRASVRMSLTGKGVKAGFAVYKDEHRYLCVWHDAAKKEIVYEVVNAAKKIAVMERASLSAGEDAKRQTQSSDGIKFSVQYTEASYAFSFEYEGSKHTFDAFDTIGLTGFDFVGPIVGVFAVAEGEQTDDVTFWDLHVE
jgi:beta-xylosidase